LGGKIGGRLGKYASRLFEIELEGLSPEDQEFEIAKRFVRFSGAAAKNAIHKSRRMHPAKATRIGFKQAAKQHAPGMLKKVRRSVGGASRRRPARSGSARGVSSGRWMRKGNRIVLLGL
jgi:hypothetical protein